MKTNPILQLTMYERLLSLPLFSGMRLTDITNIIEQTKIDFVKVNDQETFITQDSPCNGLVFVLKGDIIMETTADNYSFSVTEELHGPMVIQPEVLFGFSTRYTHTYRAKGNVSLLKIAKGDVIRKLFQQDIFHFNYFNIICTQSQRQQRSLWRNQHGNTLQLVIRFFQDHTFHPAGTKVFKIKMDVLAYHINDTRINVSNALKYLREKELVQLKRMEIVIPAMEAFSSFDFS